MRGNCGSLLMYLYVTVHWRGAVVAPASLYVTQTNDSLFGSGSTTWIGNGQAPRQKPLIFGAVLERLPREQMPDEKLKRFNWMAGMGDGNRNQSLIENKRT
jgi:hypothetical protein